MAEENLEVIVKAIQEAEMVLIGIGEEWNTPLKCMTEREPYASLLAEAKEKADWLVLFLYAHYLTRVRDERREKAYKTLFRLVSQKNYFVVTTCTDGNIFSSDFSVNSIVAPCGGYRLLQCEIGCASNLSSARECVEEVWQECLKNQGNLEKVMVPVCGSCGKRVTFNLIGQQYQEEGYLPQWDVYTKWLQGTLHHKVCVLELGVGMRYPTVIRWPFEKVAYLNDKAGFIRIHEKLYQMSEELSEKGVSIPVNSLDFFEKNCEFMPNMIK